MLRIAEAREARGWTQERLAQALETTQQTIQRWESGQTDPQVSKIKAISKALGVTVSFLLGIDAENGQEADGLSSEERRLLAMFRSITRREQTAVMEMVSAMADRGAGENGKRVRRAV